MKKPSYTKWILGTEAVGALSGILSRSGIDYYAAAVEKPAITPPAAVFPVVWTVLYALMGVSIARIWAGEGTSARKWGLNLFFVQLILNFFWSLIFFNAQAYGLALVWLLILWGVVLAMIPVFRKTDCPAAWLQVPYFLWLTFAAVLNYGVWQLNR